MRMSPFYHSPFHAAPSGIPVTRVFRDFFGYFFSDFRPWKRRDAARRMKAAAACRTPVEIQFPVRAGRRCFWENNCQPTWTKRKVPDHLSAFRHAFDFAKRRSSDGLFARALSGPDREKMCCLSSGRYY